MNRVVVPDSDTIKVTFTAQFGDKEIVMNKLLLKSLIERHHQGSRIKEIDSNLINTYDQFLYAIIDTFIED